MTRPPQGFADLCRSLAGHSGDRITRHLAACEISDLWRYVFNNPESLTELPVRS